MKRARAGGAATWPERAAWGGRLDEGWRGSGFAVFMHSFNTQQQLFLPASLSFPINKDGFFINNTSVLGLGLGLGLGL